MLLTAFSGIVVGEEDVGGSLFHVQNPDHDRDHLPDQSITDTRETEGKKLNAELYHLSVVCIESHQKHNYANYDQFA